MDFLTINPKETALPQLHQYLLGSVGPRPICFASTIDAEGKPNLAPFSFFNVVSGNPPVLVFAPNNSGRDGSPKHTYLNVKEVPEVVVNVVTYSMVQQMNVAAAPWDRGISEFEKAGFTPIASDLIKPLRVKESPVQMECRVIEIKEFGTGGGAGNLVMAEVLKIHINKDFIGADGKIDQTKIDLVGRMGGSWYCRTTPDALFQLAQPMQATIGYDSLPEHIKNSQILSANDIGILAALPAFPDAEMVAFIKEKYGPETREETARKLIAEGSTSEALALLMH
ncbi:MAG: flavin reductase family protein [Sphingomonadales bacterium]|jgi:flavin reductase (DIM6/NTAB) family NADH-FMN oxidoreductase RutF